MSRILRERSLVSPLGRPKCQAVRSQKTKLAFRSCQFSYAVTGVAGEKWVFESAVQFYAFLNKGSARSKTFFFLIPSLGICKTDVETNYNYVGLVPEVDALYSKRGPTACKQEY